MQQLYNSMLRVLNTFSELKLVSGFRCANSNAELESTRYRTDFVLIFPNGWFWTSKIRDFLKNYLGSYCRNSKQWFVLQIFNIVFFLHNEIKARIMCNTTHYCILLKGSILTTFRNKLQDFNSPLNFPYYNSYSEKHEKWYLIKYRSVFPKLVLLKNLLVFKLIS